MKYREQVEKLIALIKEKIAMVLYFLYQLYQPYQLINSSFTISKKDTI